MLIVKNPERQPPLVSILAAAANVSERLKITIRITDTIGNGAHGAWSLHYSLRAVDLGSKEHVTKHQIKAELQAELGTAYQVILESEGAPNEHIHVEYDPK